MKKPVLISLLLLLCCALGWAVYLFTNTYRQGTPVRNTLSSTTAASAVPSYDSTRPGVTATPTPPPRASSDHAAPPRPFGIPAEAARRGRLR